MLIVNFVLNAWHNLSCIVGLADCQVLCIFLKIFCQFRRQVKNNWSSILEKIERSSFILVKKKIWFLFIVLQVLMSNLAVENVGFYEPENFWLGPRSVSCWYFFLNHIPLFRNKRFALNKMFQRNASKFAIFYV